MGVVDSVDITNQGFKYTVAPEVDLEFFLMKDVTGTFANGNTLTTGFTGTVISFNSTTKLLKTTFEDVERITMETGDSNQIVLGLLFVLGDRFDKTDFKIDNHLDGGDLQLETGDSILIDATAEVVIDRIVTEDNLSNVFLIREDGTIHNGVVRLRIEDVNWW